MRAFVVALVLGAAVCPAAAADEQFLLKTPSDLDREEHVMEAPRLRLHLLLGGTVDGWLVQATDSSLVAYMESEDHWVLPPGSGRADPGDKRVQWVDPSVRRGSVVRSRSGKGFHEIKYYSIRSIYLDTRRTKNLRGVVEDAPFTADLRKFDWVWMYWGREDPPPEMVDGVPQKNFKKGLLLVGAGAILLVVAVIFGTS